MKRTEEKLEVGGGRSWKPAKGGLSFSLEFGQWGLRDKPTAWSLGREGVFGWWLLFCWATLDAQLQRVVDRVGWIPQILLPLLVCQPRL